MEHLSSLVESVKSLLPWLLLVLKNQKKDVEKLSKRTDKLDKRMSKLEKRIKEVA